MEEEEKGAGDLEEHRHLEVGQRKQQQQRTVARETKRKSGRGGVTEARFKGERALLLTLK